MLRLLLLAFIGAALAGPAFASPPPQWLHYDNNVPYQPVYRQHEGDGWAVKFEPSAAGYIQKVKIYVGNPPGNSTWDGFNLEIWNWNASASLPGSKVWGPKVFNYNHGGWVSYDTVNYHWPNTQPFVILVKQRFDYPKCDSLFCDDNQTTPNPNLSYFNGYWYYFQLADGDFLLRAYYGSYQAVEPTTLGRVKALFQ